MSSEPIQHIVLYHFTNEEDAAALIGFYDEVRERTKGYVLGVKAGAVKPVEPVRNGGYNIVCIMAFKTLEDMTYFMKEEPAHQELKASVAGKLAKGVLVVDFVSGDPTTVFKS